MRLRHWTKPCVYVYFALNLQSTKVKNSQSTGEGEQRPNSFGSWFCSPLLLSYGKVECLWNLCYSPILLGIQFLLYILYVYIRMQSLNESKLVTHSNEKRAISHFKFLTLFVSFYRSLFFFFFVLVPVFVLAPECHRIAKQTNKIVKNRFMTLFCEFTSRGNYYYWLLLFESMLSFVASGIRAKFSPLKKYIWKNTTKTLRTTFN